MAAGGPAIGIRLFSGVVESAGNNAVRNNVNNTDGGLVTTVAPMQRVLSP